MDYRDELYHYGVKGMKWGIIRAERAREEADSAKRLSEKYVNAMNRKADKRTAQAVGKGFYKKGRAERAREEAAGAKKWADKYVNAMNRKADRLEAKYKKKYKPSDDYMDSYNIKKKQLHQMSNSEIRRLNERMQLEQNYKRLNPNTVQKGYKYIAGSAVATTTILNLYNNSDKIIKLGKSVLAKQE